MASVPLAESAPIQVLIVDDSVVARAVIARVIDASDRMMVAGAVGTVAAALELLSRIRVDAILLDVALPGTDGLTALPDLIAAGGGARVLVVSSSAGDGGATAVQALALGAADTVCKPDFGASSARFGTQLVHRVERLFRQPAPADPQPVAVATVEPISVSPIAMPGDDFDLVAIGASTGGIHALSQLLRALPASFRLPILVTQHLPASFMPYFAAQLAVLAGRPCDVATDCLRIRPGRIVVAPGDAHINAVSLGDRTAAIRLSAEPVASGCLPSVDPMFASLAAVFGPRLLAIVLSGMGRDGAEGAARVHAAGGAVVVQDQASSVVWGMPGAIAGQGIADAVLPPDAIGRLVAMRARP